MIYITGHSGFVGTALTDRLKRQGTPHRGLARGTGYDLTDLTSLDDLEPGSWIVHLAGMSGVPTSWTDPAAYYLGNLAPILTVAEHARKTGAAVLLLSSYPYGTPHYLPVDEQHPLQPASPYARSKVLAEDILRGFAEDFAVPAVIFRVFNIYGPGQARSQLVSHIVSQALESDTIRVLDLEPKRDYLWIDDLIDAILLAVGAAATGCEIYNVGSGVSHSVRDIINAVTAIVGPRIVECENRPRQNEIPECYSDSRKLSDTYGWLAKTELMTGIASLLNTGPQLAHLRE